ncbi:MAG: hypothetical protein GY925_01760 [Actinomycetia bacterium]|nr:hypothetical protein [Actinomycetes bacterium]
MDLTLEYTINRTVVTTGGGLAGGATGVKWGGSIGCAVGGPAGCAVGAILFGGIGAYAGYKAANKAIELLYDYSYEEVYGSE